MNSCCRSGTSPSRSPRPWSSSARSWCAIRALPKASPSALDALTIGADKVIDDSAVYLALRNAYWRLRNDPSREGVASVVDQLWEVALRIEDGDLPEAERAVKAAQDALMQALKENASPEEIKRLVDELRSALSRYLQALASQQQRQGQPARRKQSRTAISSSRSRISTSF